VEILGGEVGTIGPQVLSGFNAEGVKADRSQRPGLHDATPVAGRVGRCDSSVRAGVVAEAWVGSIDDVSHHGVQGDQLVSYIVGGHSAPALAYVVAMLGRA
jgi:hypothetical protein